MAPLVQISPRDMSQTVGGSTSGEQGYVKNLGHPTGGIMQASSSSDSGGSAGGGSGGGVSRPLWRALSSVVSPKFTTSCAPPQSPDLPLPLLPLPPLPLDLPPDLPFPLLEQSISLCDPLHVRQTWLKPMVQPEAEQPPSFQA